MNNTRTRRTQMRTEEPPATTPAPVAIRQAETVKPPILPPHLKVEPDFARIEDTVRLYGINRTRLYEEAGAGNIRMVKLGRAALVDLASLRAFIASLPEATIRVQRRRGKASA